MEFINLFEISEIVTFWEELILRRVRPPHEVLQTVLESNFCCKEIVPIEVVNKLPLLQLIFYHAGLRLKDDVLQMKDQTLSVLIPVPTSKL